MQKWEWRWDTREWKLEEKEELAVEKLEKMMTWK